MMFKKCYYASVVTYLEFVHDNIRMTLSEAVLSEKRCTQLLNRQTKMYNDYCYYWEHSNTKNVENLQQNLDGA